MAPGISLSTSATRAARKAPENVPMSIGWSDCFASTGSAEITMPTTAAKPASHMLRPNRIEFLPVRRLVTKARLTATLTPKHGLFGVGVQPHPVHNSFTPQAIHLRSLGRVAQETRLMQKS